MCTPTDSTLTRLPIGARAPLRAYNDSIDDQRRKDLYAYAAKVVGSRTSEDVQRARAERLTAWALALEQRGWTRLLVPTRLRTLARNPQADVVGSHAVRAVRKHTDQTHSDVLALIDELLTIGMCEQPAPGRESGHIPVDDWRAQGASPALRRVIA